MAMQATKQYIENSRMENNTSKNIQTCEELVQRESRYSDYPMKINPINRFWNESQIDIVSESLNERELAIENTNKYRKRVLENRLIMDFAIELVDH